MAMPMGVAGQDVGSAVAIRGLELIAHVALPRSSRPIRGMALLRSLDSYRYAWRSALRSVKAGQRPPRLQRAVMHCPHRYIIAIAQASSKHFTPFPGPNAPATYKQEPISDDEGDLFSFRKNTVVRQ